MKIKIMIGLVLLIFLGGAFWTNRSEILLAYVKHKTDTEFLVGPNTVIPWQPGPEDEKSPREGRPNIIFILADDLGYNDISTFGGGIAGGLIQTPNIDQLAAEGAVFEQSYSGGATCAPSRAMLLTGRYPTRTGFEFTPTPSGMPLLVTTISSQNAKKDEKMPLGRYHVWADAAAAPFEEQGLPSSEVTIAEILKSSDYYTAHIGKWHLGRNQESSPNSQGFDDSLFMASGLYLPENDPGVVNAKLEFDPIDKFLWARLSYAASFNNPGNERFKPGGYLSDYWTDEAINVIRANKNRPFFLYLAHWGPHTPLQATVEDYEAVGEIKPHRLRVYAAMIRAIDRSVGRINAVLREESLEENTIIVFSSDNGGAGYVGLPDINKPFRGWKLTNFEGGLRVPLFIKWPSKIQAGKRINEPVSHLDIMPTLAAAAGTELPRDRAIDGLNLLPLLTEAENTAWQRETLFWQNGHYLVVRHGDWKLQITSDSKQRWLFNLDEDPTEQINLVNTHPQKVTELMVLLSEHKKSARDPLYPSVAEVAVKIDKTLNEEFEEGDEFVYYPN